MSAKIPEVSGDDPLPRPRRPLRALDAALRRDRSRCSDVEHFGRSTRGGEIPGAWAACSPDSARVEAWAHQPGGLLIDCLEMAHGFAEGEGLACVAFLGRISHADLPSARQRTFGSSRASGSTDSKEMHRPRPEGASAAIRRGRKHASTPKRRHPLARSRSERALERSRAAQEFASEARGASPSASPDSIVGLMHMLFSAAFFQHGSKRAHGASPTSATLTPRRALAPKSRGAPRRASRCSSVRRR